VVPTSTTPRNLCFPDKLKEITINVPVRVREMGSNSMIRLSLLCLCLIPGLSFADSYDRFLAFYEDVKTGIEFQLVDEVPAYSAAAMVQRHATIQDHRAQLDTIDPSDWNRTQQINYLVVRSELDELDFNHRVFRRWSRDPGFYTAVYLAYGPSSAHKLEIPEEFPMDEETLATFKPRLEAVPRLYAAAKENLTEPVGDLTRLAIRGKETELERFSELGDTLAEHHADLVPAVDAAIAAVTAYRDWLVSIVDELPVHAGIGRENYEWYLRYAQLFPYDVDALMTIAARELERSRASLALAEHRNRNVPALDPADSLEDYRALQRVRENEIKAFLANEAVFTIPEWMSEDLLDVSETWRRRADGTRVFWEEIDQRDPGPLRAHNLPGHTLDVRTQESDERPVRGLMRPFQSGIRIEGWATYLEETLHHLGFRTSSPHTSELVWILLAARAVRVPTEILMHTNALTVTEAVDYMMRATPYWMDDMVAWTDCDLYLRQPGYGIGYLMGKVQIEELLAASHTQKGDRFDLTAFHDSFLGAGLIPISLIHWGMTEDEALGEWLFQWEPLPGSRSKESVR